MAIGLTCTRVSILGDIVQRLRWQDIVDILVLTLVVFRVYTWLRGTTALRIGLGMLLLVGAAFAADELGLLLTAYVLQALGAVATLVVVVIFRDEIRRALVRVNPLRWWRERRAAPADRSAFAPLARAVFALAQHHIGAILVLPREDPVTGHLTGGIKLDALLSPELLEAIFHARSPIHDGAAVIEDGRVRLAGAFLPISTATDLPDHMGSRHRAALGLAEHCDAVVVVVSEERGRVSVAEHGRFVPAIADAGTLITCLDRLVRHQSAHTEPLRRTRNGLAFVASLVLVATAWYVVVAGPGTVVTRSVAVELRNLPPGLEAEPSRPQEVNVQVHGPRTLLGELDAGDVTAGVDLTDARPGQRRVEVQAEVPSGFRVLKVAPRHATVRLRDAEKSAPD
jgi:diadenylate cyclase